MSRETFEALLEALNGESPPETVYDDLRKEYDSVLSENDAANAKIAAQNGQLEQALADLGAAKATNWDLLQKVPSDSGTVTDNDVEDGLTVNDYEDLFDFNK